jgi:hypothetical protein
MKATCGPALHKVHKKRAGRMKKFTEPVKWYDEEKDAHVIDEHIHAVEYLWSEELTADTVRKRMNAAEAIAQSELRASSEAKALGMESGLE